MLLRITRDGAPNEESRPCNREPERKQEEGADTDEAREAPMRHESPKEMLQTRHDRDVDAHGWNQGRFRYERRMNRPKIPQASDDFAQARVVQPRSRQLTPARESR